MKTFESPDAILDFAITNEEEAYEFYSKLAGTMKNPVISRIFKDFSEEELGHKKKLLDVKKNNLLVAATEKVMDLKIGDYTVKEALTPNMTYQDALILAMKKEKAAFRLYMNLSEKVDDGNLKTLFLFLAQEEAKHKLRFEIEYDEYILTDN